MGMGEPLYNYNEVIKSIHILRDRNGLNLPTDGITVSTVGPIEQLNKLREEHIKIQLTLSLHATTQKLRNKIMPGMRKNDIEKTVENLLEYSQRHNRTVVIAYLLLPGVNDRPSDVIQLKKWFVNKNIMINLLQYNNTSITKITRPNKQVLTQFKRKLEEVGLKVKIRESYGQDVNAACGQLVSKYNSCLLYTSPSPRDRTRSRMPSSA